MSDYTSITLHTPEQLVSGEWEVRVTGFSEGPMVRRFKTEAEALEGHASLKGELDRIAGVVQ